MSVSYGGQSLGKPRLILDDRVWAMQFTADGKGLLTDTGVIGRIEWPSKNHQVLWRPHAELPGPPPEPGESMTRATFAPDGTLFANSDYDNKLHVHESATGKRLHTLQGRRTLFNATATAWSSDSGRLAVGADHEVVIYDIKTGTAVQKLAFGNSDIAVLAWSPDGKWIVVETAKGGGKDGSVLLRSLQNGSENVLTGNRQTHFSFSPDSKILAVGTEKTESDGWRPMFYLWDLVAGKEIISRNSEDYNCLVHSPDGKFLVACGLNNLEVLDGRTGLQVCRRNSDSINNHIWSAAFSPDGKILATGNEHRVCFRDTTTWNEIDPDEVLRSSVSALAFSRDGRHLVTGGSNGDLVLWDWEKKAPVWKRFEAATAWEIRGLSIDPTARWIGVVQPAYQSRNSWIRLVDFATGNFARWVDVPGVTEVAPLFHPSRRTAYLATRGQELVEWDCESGESLHKLPIPFLRATAAGRSRAISAMGFDPATPEFVWWNAGNHASGQIDVRNGVESGAHETRFLGPGSAWIPPRGHEFAAMGAPEPISREANENGPTVRHPSGLMQFSASRQRVRVFDFLSQSFIHAFELGSGEIRTIALSPDGLTLIAACDGGVCYVSLEGPPVTAGTSPEVLWRLMGGENQWQAYQAAWASRRQPDYLAFIKSHLAPARELRAGELARVKALLDDSDPEVRQSAARQWLDLGQEIDRATLETLRENGLSEDWPHGATMNPAFSSGIDRRGPIPLLTPLSAYRREMLAVMLLKENHSEASRHLLEQLAVGYAGAPLTKAAASALASQR